MIPEVLINKIILYNSTVLSDIFRSRLKINSLMILINIRSNKYIRLYHYMQEKPVFHDRWRDNIERKIRMYKGYYSGVT